MLLNRYRSQTMYVFLLIFGIFMEPCDSTLPNGHEDYESPGEDGDAFFALRSCHGVLQGDSGEFFSPDYLCSNPPLWCKWTIQVDPGKHIRLYLKDFTPADACHAKLDQIQLAEPSGVSGGNKVLEKCWQQAKYTSLSNTLHVVLLIRGSPIPPFRGFYGRYQAFEPPIVYKSHGEDAEGKWMKEDERHETEVKPTVFRGDLIKYVPTEEGEPTQPSLMESTTTEMLENYSEMEEYFDLLTSVSNELSFEEDEPIAQQNPSSLASVQVEEDEQSAASSEETVEERERFEPDLTWKRMVNHTEDIIPRPSSTIHSTTSTPTLAVVPTLDTSRLERSASDTPTRFSDKAEIHSPSSNMHAKVVRSTESVISPYAFHHILPDLRRSVDARSLHAPLTTEEHVSYTANIVSVERSHLVLTDPTDQGDDLVVGTSWRMNDAEQLSTTASPMPDDEQDNQMAPFPNMVGLLSTEGHARNHTEVPFLPGDHMYEVSVELTFSLENDSEEHWDHLSSTLLMSTKELIHEQLKFHMTSVTISSKRIKRLSAGVLFILWLQMVDGTNGLMFRSTLHTALQELVSTNISLHGSSEYAMIISLSTADVNECSTQLVLCDVNAECLNQFGSYTCRCQPGFEDASRLGSGGTLCVDLKAAGCALASSSLMVQSIYVVAFLLSFLLLMLMIVMAVLYHRHHRGTFLVRCQSSDLGSGERDGNNNNNDGSADSNSDLPPPPPIRRPKEGWAHPKDCCTTVDLPLLRFSPLNPLDGYMESGDGTPKGS